MNSNFQNGNGKMEKWNGKIGDQATDNLNNDNLNVSKAAGPDSDLDISKAAHIEEGLDFILGHFQEPLFPRTVSTKSTEGRQMTVNNREEALTVFRLSNWLDCRISAYPYWRPSKVSDFADIRNEISPNFIMGDLDKNNFKNERSLKLALTAVLNNINTKIVGYPTVLWSGNGYHIYQPIHVPIILENIVEFDTTEEPSREFLRFAERYLTDGKSDKAHNSSVSLNNCMTRVPGSINSKNGEQVRIIKRWNNQRPHIKLMIGSFCAYLADQQLKKELELQKKYSFGSNNNGNHYIIDWIERLLQTPMDEHRKFAVWMILPQYLINIRKMSHEQSYIIIQKWLDRCNELKRLDRAATKQKLKAGFNAAEKGFRPIGREKLKNWKPELYQMLLSSY